jgi:hypothetical protein
MIVQAPTATAQPGWAALELRAPSAELSGEFVSRPGLCSVLCFSLQGSYRDHRMFIRRPGPHHVRFI